MTWVALLLLNFLPVQEIPPFRYWYDARLVSLYDADTGTFSIDLGLGVCVEEKVRFARIDAWEIRGAERAKGLVAKAFVDSLLFDRRIVLKTDRDRGGKYARTVAEVYILDGSRGVNVNDLTVVFGHAEYIDY